MADKKFAEKPNAISKKLLVGYAFDTKVSFTTTNKGRLTFLANTSLTMLIYSTYVLGFTMTQNSETAWLFSIVIALIYAFICGYFYKSDGNTGFSYSVLKFVMAIILSYTLAVIFNLLALFLLLAIILSFFPSFFPPLMNVGILLGQVIPMTIIMAYYLALLIFFWVYILEEKFTGILAPLICSARILAIFSLKFLPVWTISIIIGLDLAVYISSIMIWQPNNLQKTS